MGGCASKPKDLDVTEKAPATVEAPAPVEAPAVATDKAEAEPALQETKEGDESKDKPVVEASVPAPKVAKTEEAEAKPAEDLKEAKAEAQEQAKETPKEETKEAENVDKA